MAATQGRAFWILDDISPLRQADADRGRVRTRLLVPAPAERVQTGAALVDRIDGWMNAVVEEDDEHFLDALHSPARLDFNLMWLLGEVDRMEPPITAGMAERVADVRGGWSRRHAEYEAIVEEDPAAFSELTAEHGTPPVTVPDFPHELPSKRWTNTLPTC